MLVLINKRYEVEVIFRQHYVICLYWSKLLAEMGENVLIFRRKQGDEETFLTIPLNSQWSYLLVYPLCFIPPGLAGLLTNAFILVDEA